MVKRRGGRSRLVRRRATPLSTRMGGRKWRKNYGIVKIKRTTYGGNWTQSTVSTSGFWRYLTYSLQDMNNYTEVTNLFDEYKITGIMVKFVPRYDSFAGNNTTDVVQPNVTNQTGNYITTYIDTSSSLTPSGTFTSSTYNTFIENCNGASKMRQGLKPFTIFFRPKIPNDVGGTSTSHQSPKWLSTASPSIVHSGAHVFMHDVNFVGSSGQSYDMFVTHYVQARGLH